MSNFCFFKKHASEYSWSSIFPTSLVMSSGTIPESEITMSKSVHILRLLVHIAKLTSRKVVLNYLPVLHSWARHFPPFIVIAHYLFFWLPVAFSWPKPHMFLPPQKKPWSAQKEHLNNSSCERDLRIMWRKLVKLFHLTSLSQNSTPTVTYLFLPVTFSLYYEPCIILNLLCVQVI